MLDTGPLKLRAHDTEDLQALAVCLQDALIPVSDIAYLKPKKRFVMVANRFMWEGNASTPDPAQALKPAAANPDTDAKFDDAGRAPFYARVNCAVCFDWVRSVRFRNLDLRHADQILNLLTLEADADAITLVFSGGGEIRLKVSKIRCHLEDLGEPWPTRWRPTHSEPEAPPREPG